MKSTKRFKAALAAVLVLALSPLFGGAAFAEDSSATTYSGNKTAVTDPSTIWDWQGLVENDTSSVGRIWTDKTVSDNEISKNGITVSKENGADFLTALTALSSTSNLSDTATTPLDIVLVLDASGSMDSAMGSGDDTKRIDALKSAANSFIDEIANQNATVKDAAKQHQVAIVKFAGDKTDKVGNDTYYAKGYRYNYSQVMKKLAPCTNDTKGDFSSQVNAIKPAGATNAAAGLELAKGQTSGRSDAKKVVIFFTDGTPTTQSSFSPNVASDAVGHAEKMKDAGAAVYSIGIFQGAHPDIDPVSDSTSNENKFMHAVSSNYPSATYSYKKTSGKYEWNFGDRAKGSDGKDATFYKSATNADELKHVFDDISKEIIKGAGYPTETSEGYERTTGYITFDDQLGDYMQVTDLSKLVYNGTVYGCKSKTTEGNVDTYHFSGSVNSGLAAADLKDVVITVTRSDNAAVGDKVQVKVPASLIPLRNFAIDLAKDTMSVSDTTPISVLYSSGVKPAALDLLENPDDAMKAYMEKNTDATGRVNFYANKWTGKETGDVVAAFEPAAGNSYYYFTQDTPIYTDEACTVPAKSVESGSTYYYKHNYYAMEGGKPVAKTEHVPFPGDAAEKVEGAIGKDSAGACYLKSGTPRLTYVNELHKVKEENRTATAKDVLNPKWSGVEQSSAQTLINAHLGNNGKLSVDVPGTLTVTKQLKLPDGYNADDFANESFEFTIAMQDAVGKNFNAVVKNANGQQQGDKFVLAFGQDGQAKHSLKPGETLYVYGLSAGWNYKVSETPRAGFTAEAAGAEGKIAAGETSAVTYTNTYAASGTLDGETYLKGEKVLTGRDWLADTFVFIMKDADTSVEAPMPPTNTLGASKGEARVTVTSKDAKDGVPVSFHFESIGYTKPGTYTYQIWESEELSQLRAGVSASQALYQVVVTVTDEGHNGTLTVKSKMTKLADDDGVRYEKPQLVENDTASFVNEYDTSVVKWTPSGTKTYTDATGENPLKSDMFHVIACTDNVRAPLPKGEGVTRVDYEWGGKMWYGALTTVEAGGSIAFPQATFTFNDIPSGATEAIFEYTIVEVVKVDDTWRAVRDVLADKTFDPVGMVYDQTVWTAKVTIADVGGKLELSAKYYKNDSEEPITGAMFSFDNSYNPEPAKLEGDTAIHGTKVLTGRDMAKGETFGFKLSAADDATQVAIEAGNIVIPQREAEVSGAKAGIEAGFSFGEMTFKKPGMYSFAVQEDKYCGNGLDAAGAATGGIVFDRHVHKVTVKVTDDHKGKLVAEVSYDNGPAKFENKYEQNAQFSGITVQKTLNGRDMAADEFSFSIHGVDKEGAVAATEAEARLTDSDRSFTNAARADGVACDMAKMNGVAFTQDDIGKTFAYEVREVVPAAADAKPGVSYDKSVHTLEITVGMSVDADKHLTLTTKLDGEVVDSAIVAFVNGYQATPTSYDTATAGLNKVLEGRNWTDADNFTFELKALDGGPLPKDAAGNDMTNVTVTKANAESFGFGAIEFTSDMVKAEPDHKRTFAYEVREVVPVDGHKLPGIHYDDNVATIKVTVSDDGSGMLKASAVAENTRFVNRYAAEIDYTAAGGLNVAKTLTGRDMAEGQFTIKVTPGDEASAYALGLPLEGAEIAMPAAADGAQAVKSALGEQHVVLRQSDVGKTYTYKVVEVQAAADGYTYDTTEYTVTVMAWDDPQKAALTVTTEVAGPEGVKTYVYGADPSAAGTGPAVVPFANAYAASTDNPGGTAAQVTATKELTGRPLSAGEFTFTVKYATGGDDLRTAKNAADGTVTFDRLHYTTEMLEGLVKDGNAYKTSDQGVISWTVSYLAYEKTDGLAGQGVTPQTQPIPFTVTVVDNGDGSLTATANLDKGLKFENTYSTGDPVQVGLSGVKMLQAAPGLAPASIEGKFTFTVTSDDAAAPMPERTTAKNAADGSVDFGTIEFTLDDLNRALGVNDQTAIANADKAEADVAKAADQVAAPAKEADADAAKAADADASKAAADADKVAASADNASAQADDGDKPAAGDGQGAGAVAAPDAASGTVDEVAPGNQPADQPANPEPESGKPRSHVFTYKVTESGSVPGVINDAAATKTVSFKVTDDGAGKLTVERQGDAATPAFSFANTYTVEPANSSVTDQVTVTKTLTGRDMAAGEFTFELLEGEDVVATGANAADGSVTLNAVKYTQPGTHRYTLHEVGGGTVANGVTYDGATYTVVTTVKDNGDGTLSVAHALEGAREATFANAYQATSTTVTIGATKTLVGKNLENGQFTFVLTAADGTELKAKNAADGKIAFPALTFDKPGTYEFALTELDDAQANVTYDKRAYKVTVTVVDDGLGHLNATVAGDADVLAFTNTYAEPPVPVQPAQPGGKTFTPRGPIGKVLTQTGDDKLALVLPLAAVALAGAASIAALLIMRRRDKR
ncbi:Spy0128 family protein [Senegalimassilia anaerobia]|uniref:Spy0128 family protein n=1 Tax=Senegalimassilia anaerobia TaxID=1473216 RepID=UPI003A977BF5